MDMMRASRGSILVVDDDDTIRDMEQQILQDEGYDTIGVPSGDAALSALRQGVVRPKLILLDIWMEQADSGWRVLEALQADSATTSIPVVVTSAHVFMMAEMRKKFAQPHYAFLKKPYELSSLLATIKELIDARLST